MKMAKHSQLTMAGCAVMLVGLLVLSRLGMRPGGVPPLLRARSPWC